MRKFNEKISGVLDERKGARIGLGAYAVYMARLYIWSVNVLGDVGC
jgi:hypothetical protein